MDWEFDWTSSRVAPSAPSYIQNNPIYSEDINQDVDIFGALEKLASLKDKGILTDSEYTAKKAELLARL